MLRPDRRRRGPDPSLPARMFILGSGAVLAYAGMLWDRPALVTVAIAELAFGLFLSLRARKNAFAQRDADDSGDTGADVSPGDSPDAHADNPRDHNRGV